VFVASVDDFFTVRGRGRFIVTETTMDLYDDSLLDAIHVETLLSWVHTALHASSHTQPLSNPQMAPSSAPITPSSSPY
jgi:hypothetical protein